MNMNYKYNPINNSINQKKNNSNINNTIYNYNRKMKKMNTNNQKNKSIFNIGIYNYNLYDNIFLKKKIENKLRQYKYNSFVKENSINKNNSCTSKIKEKSKNKNINSMDKNIKEKNQINTKKNINHIKSINYASIYLEAINNKTPNHNIKNIFNDKNKKIYNESVYTIRTVLNKHYNKKYQVYLNQIVKNQTSYVKIKKNQLSLTKRLNNKEIFVKEKLKRDTQSTEYE